MKLRPGDIFLVHKRTPLTFLIRKVQKAQAGDGQAFYTHAGTILDEQGTTFEALLWVRRRNFFEAYAKTHSYMVLRHREMTPSTFRKGFHTVKDYEGNLYPVHRLFLFLVPVLADKLNVFDWGVCSELAALHWYGGGLLDGWSGTMPSDLEDLGRYLPNIDIVKERRL